MGRIQKAPVRGISIKLQEEERERRDNYVPDVSALEVETVEVDADTKNMLTALNFPNLAVTVLQTQPNSGPRVLDGQRRAPRERRND
jgi:small subunit ribosomal protein S17e